MTARVVEPNRPKRGFVAGAGYIGGALARNLVDAGWEMVALTRNESMGRELERDGIRAIIASLEDDSWHRQVEGQLDAVWNTVGSGGGGLAGFETSYLGGNRSIARWLGAGVATTDFFAFTGSVSVYPQTDGEWVDENGSTKGCGAGAEILLAAEAVVRESFPETVVRGTCRLAGIYGPNRHLLLNRLLEGSETVPGSPEVWLNLIHQMDAVRALAALPGTKHGPVFSYNLSDGNPGRRGEIVEWLAGELGRPVPPFDPSRSARPTAARTGAGGAVPNRRIDSSRIWKAIGVDPLYLSYKNGYKNILNGLGLMP